MGRRAGIRDNWRAEVYQHPRIGDACRVLLLRLADTMTDRGFVSVPHARLAADLGVDSRRIKARIAEATKADLLRRTGGGYRGRTSEYVANFPAAMGTAERTPFSGMGTAHSHPFERPQNGPLSPSDQAVMGTAERTPNTRALVDERRRRTDTVRKLRVLPECSAGQRRNEGRAERVVALAALSRWARLAYAPLDYLAAEAAS